MEEVWPDRDLDYPGQAPITDPNNLVQTEKNVKKEKEILEMNKDSATFLDSCPFSEQQIKTNTNTRNQLIFCCCKAIEILFKTPQS